MLLAKEMCESAFYPYLLGMDNKSGLFYWYGRKLVM